MTRLSDQQVEDLETAVRSATTSIDVHRPAILELIREVKTARKNDRFAQNMRMTSVRSRGRR